MSHQGGKGKGKARGSVSAGYPTPWCEWTWNADRGLYYRARERAKGEWEYEWEQTTALSSTPRTEYPNTSLSSSQSTITQQIFNTAIDPLAGMTDSLASINLTEDNLPVPKNVFEVKTRKPNKTEERFDKNYRQHHKREFKVGKLIKMLWVEPRGNTAGSVGAASQYTRRGEEFSKIRRFVIVKLMSGHCICIAIMSYGGKGTTKPGVHVHEHAIIHTTPEPIPLAGETALAKAPIKVRPYTSEHKLAVASRLNYAKVYSVEYNVKLQFIGEVEEDCRWKVAATYNQVHGPLPFTAPSTFSSSPTNYGLSSTTTGQAQATTWSSGATNTEGYYSANGEPSNTSQTAYSGSYTGNSGSWAAPQVAQWAPSDAYPALEDRSGSQGGTYPGGSKYPESRNDRTWNR